jgi:hypothetical protein
MTTTRTPLLLAYLPPYFCRPLAPALALALGLAAGHARAEAPKDERYALGWARLEGAERCIGSRELASNVETSLKRRVFAPASRADRSIDGRVAPRPEGGFRAVVQLSDAAGTVLGSRELTSDGPDCRTLDEPLALSIALLIDPDTNGWGGRGEAREPDAADKPDAAPPRPGARPAPAPAARRDAPAAGPERQRRTERFEASALVGYVTGDQIVPHESIGGDGLNVGVGARLGYTFRSGAWVGASYTFYTGGEIGTFSHDPSTFDRAYHHGDFRAHVLGPELGYAFALGPFEARPYVGVGVAVFDLRLQPTFATASPPPTPDGLPPGSPPPTTDGLPPGSPLVSAAAWPGFALTLPLGDAFFAGVDARWALVYGAPAQNNVGAFAAAGMRF